MRIFKIFVRAQYFIYIYIYIYIFSCKLSYLKPCPSPFKYPINLFFMKPNKKLERYIPMYLNNNNNRQFFLREFQSMLMIVIYHQTKT